MPVLHPFKGECAFLWVACCKRISIFEYGCTTLTLFVCRGSKQEVHTLVIHKGHAYQHRFIISSHTLEHHHTLAKPGLWNISYRFVEQLFGGCDIATRIEGREQTLPHASSFHPDRLHLKVLACHKDKHPIFASFSQERCQILRGPLDLFGDRGPLIQHDEVRSVAYTTCASLSFPLL